MDIYEPAFLLEGLGFARRALTAPAPPLAPQSRTPHRSPETDRPLLCRSAVCLHSQCHQRHSIHSQPPHVARCQRPEGPFARSARPAGSAQLLGHMVRPLQRRNADARGDGKAVRHPAASGSSSRRSTTAKTKARIPAFLAEFKVGFPVWYGATRDDLDQLKLGGAVPDTAFLDAEGRVVARILGQARARRSQAMAGLVDRR